MCAVCTHGNIAARSCREGKMHRHLSGVRGPDGGGARAPSRKAIIQQFIVQFYQKARLKLVLEARRGVPLILSLWELANIEVIV